MSNKQEVLRNLPGVDKLLNNPIIKGLLDIHQEDLVKFVIRESLSSLRKNPPKELNDERVLTEINRRLDRLTGNSLRKVLNATGVIVYTNLGRAPYSDHLIAEASKTLSGYNNLEYNLDKGERGSRHNHLTEKLKFLTGAEDVLLVNNNAAAVILVLRSFAKNKEVIVSRGELIEIGGSFRIPEIMAASDCKMVEVGSTNKTHTKDYSSAITPQTSILFKAHKSNYVIQGFTKEVSLDEMVSLGKKNKLLVFYDMGSGLLRKTSTPVLSHEPDVKQTLNKGIDLVSFSGDKLIGGPQAGIIAGKAKYIAQLKKEPMVRALRVGKTTLAFMEAALNYYLDEDQLVKNNSIFSTLHQTQQELQNKAEKLMQLFKEKGIPSRIVQNDGYCGGGALPGECVPSLAVQIDFEFVSGKERSQFSERVFKNLLQQDIPVIGILRKGEILFDVMTVPEKELSILVEMTSPVLLNLK